MDNTDFGKFSYERRVKKIVSDVRVEYKEFSFDFPQDWSSVSHYRVG